ncbi:hypothetical protein SAY86_028738 [Trapa natans]|uniref:Yippee domain-containing protein n=1 Tax=Trapa natans TaxID=22666 RepID=A0AAN7RB15_TRANT|nr:hypothetical protein SAY86_028738 [Trapa natans]
MEADRMTSATPPCRPNNYRSPVDAARYSAGAPKFCSNFRAGTAFHSRRGKAYLFNKAVNIILGTLEERMMLSGLHTVNDVFCCCCGQIVGWKYETTHEKCQKYKEGKFSLRPERETSPIYNYNGWTGCIVIWRKKMGFLSLDPRPEPASWLNLYACLSLSIVTATRNDPGNADAHKGGHICKVKREWRPSL